MEITKQQTVKIKGIAVLMLLFHHLFLNSERADMCSYITGRVGEQILIQVALLGKICVPIFLILSGYGINESSKNIQGGGIA